MILSSAPCVTVGMGLSREAMLDRQVVETVHCRTDYKRAEKAGEETVKVGVMFTEKEDYNTARA